MCGGCDNDTLYDSQFVVDVGKMTVAMILMVVQMLYGSQCGGSWTND